MALLDRTDAPTPHELRSGAETADPSLRAERGSRLAAWLGWAICMIFAACIGVGIWLQYLRGESLLDFVNYIALAVSFGLFALVGTLIVTRRPDNVMGWLYCAIGLGTGSMLPLAISTTRWQRRSGHSRL